MRAVVQRVKRCSVTVDNCIAGEISHGLLIYLGISESDNNRTADYTVNKIAGLRIFEDTDGQMNLSSRDVDAQMCVVSQFTLYGDTRKGMRPSYSKAAPPAAAVPLYEYFVISLRELGFHTATGVFGAHMDVEYINDGPVTILIDSDKIF